MSRIRVILSKPAVLAWSVVLLTASCATIPATGVKVVQKQKDIDGTWCSFMGQVSANPHVDAAQTEVELREKAGQRGGNTLLLLAGNSAPARGKAYFCYSPGPEGSSGYTGWGNGGGKYGPDVVVPESYPPGSPQPVQSRN